MRVLFLGISELFKNHTLSTDLERYRGNLKDGFPDGQGVMMEDNKNCYSGEWRNGCRHGSGESITHYPAARRIQHYVGTYKFNLRSGLGKTRYFLHNGILFGTYVGEWKNNDWEGQGSITSGDSTASGIFHKGSLMEDEVKNSFFGLFQVTVIKVKGGISEKTLLGKIFT